MRQSARAERPLLAVLTALWIAVVAAGMAGLWHYGLSRGAPAAAPARADAAADGRAHLVMLAHPHCPCTRASLAELERLMAQAHGQVRADVYFLAPAEMPADWVESALWARAAAIPGVRVWRDPDGRTAAGYGAATSGQVVLYDAGGRRLFQGGITAARGHEGDNAGRAAVLAALAGATPADTPVFGCPLAAAPAAACEEGIAACPL